MVFKISFYILQLFSSLSLALGKLPLAVVAQRVPAEGSSHLMDHAMVVIRNIRTTFEGRLFLANEHSRKFLLEDQGPVHDGYDAVASMMIPALVGYFQKLFATSGLPRPRITTIGHGNFGSGIATIVARDLSLHVKLAAGDVAVEHNLVAFEGGPVGGYDFTSELRKNVNVRNIVSMDSGFSQLPCEVVKGCGTGSQVRTGSIGEQIGPYLRLPGRVSVSCE